MAQHNDYGIYAEDTACNYLEAQGYLILARNWRWRHFEIDIIATNRQELVIVEVKARNTDFFEQPTQTVTRAQQKNLVQAAEAYIIKHNIQLPVRFDIIGILGKNAAPHHIEYAFIPGF